MRHFYVRLVDMPDSLHRFIRDETPGLWRELTGQPFTGQIEAGYDDPRRGGWTTIAIRDDIDPCGSFGDTLHTERDDPTWINIHPDFARSPHTFVHEFGHALRFDHVRDLRAVMARSGGSDSFTTQEKYHAQLAYGVGRGAKCCGWPFSAECF